MLVPETSDPREKLGWAAELFNNQERPLPAERLIREAIEICIDSNDYSCLGRANVTYGFFFRSDSIGKWEKFYRENGFMDKEATFDNRLEISKRYFEKGIAYYVKTGEYDALTNAYLNLGFAYYFLGEHKEECGPYEKSLEAYQKNITRNPDANVAVPEGASSFPEYVAGQQKRAGCI
ncbi:tetratricopeptide repeat protein [Thiogranum longum]|nr:tetratricopeptide repeat protein [Thiogranum longum]